MQTVNAGRRWFQFRLGTLFVVVTILATFLGYHVNWMRQRHRFLLDVDRSAEFPGRGEGMQPRAPAFLRFLGERAQKLVVVSINDDSHEGLNEHAKKLLVVAPRLFPEADIFTVYVSPQGRSKFEPVSKLGF